MTGPLPIPWNLNLLPWGSVLANVESWKAVALARAVRLLVGLTLVLALAAPSAGAADPRRHTIPTAGASIAVPSAWKVVDERLVTDSAAFRRFIDENPSLKPFVRQMTGPGSLIKLMAFDLERSAGFATNVNVVVSAPSPGITLARLATVYKQQLRTLVPGLQGPVATSVVSLPAGRALRASYRVRYAFGGRTVTVQSLQYLLLRPDKSLVVTFTTLPTQSSARRASFTTIARSLRFG